MSSTPYELEILEDGVVDGCLFTPPFPLSICDCLPNKSKLIAAIIQSTRPTHGLLDTSRRGFCEIEEILGMGIETGWRSSKYTEVTAMNRVPKLV